jgi:ABC-type transporter Mla subunit MlaD
VLVELGTGSDGRGQDVNSAIKSLGDATDDLARVTSTLHGRSQDLSGFVVSSEQLNRDVQQAPLDSQIQDTNTVLRGLVEVDDHIGSGIDHTAVFLQQLDVVMNGNSGNLAATLDRAPGTVTRLRTVLVEGTTLVNGVNPSVPNLLTAVVETKSAFGGADANGHFVRIQAITGACTLGLSAGCASPGTSQAQGSGQSPGSASTQQTLTAGQARPALPTGTMTDRDLLGLFLGN